MPNYQYDCTKCDAQRQEVRCLSERDFPAHCECGAVMVRVTSAPKRVRRATTAPPSFCHPRT